MPAALKLRGLLLAAAALLPVPARAAPAGEEAGLRIVSPEDRRTFYRTGGREQVGQRVHLHVEAEILRAKPRTFRGSDGRDWLEFENRTVPLVVDPSSPHWVQVKRHLAGAGEFCLRGLVRVPEGDERRRAHFYVETVKRAPGTWR
jgi:hypothetical protein